MEQLEQSVTVPPMQTEIFRSRQRPWTRNDAYNATSTPVSPVMSRRASHESDRNSTVSGITNHHFASNPINVSPSSAYVAALGASQVVSEHQASRKTASSDSEDEDDKGKDDVEFSGPALTLINAFLDQLLYSFLSSARSTSLHALRPAVTDVLKHRLAREAISSADAELAELLAGTEEEEEMDTKHKAQEAKRKWDLELVWKRTRLRVMVYMRLGEMEDEDEQRYVEQQQLFQGPERRFSSNSGLVSWSAAIFLTSVLEYVAEQALQVAGQAAYTRVRRESQGRPSTSSNEAAESDVIVEEHDVEKIALNPSLGRLWRTWRKALRSHTSHFYKHSPSASRASRENMRSAMSQRRTSFDTNHDGSVIDESRPMSRDLQDAIPDAQYSEDVLAANIPLPMEDQTRDVDEIVAVGLARDPDEHDGQYFHTSEPYAEHVLAPLIPLPLHSNQKDLDDLLVPGLATDPDDEQQTRHPLDEPYPELMVALLVCAPMANAKCDVDEIEVPGLARDPDSEDKDLSSTALGGPQRRNSIGAFSSQSATSGLLTSGHTTTTSTNTAGKQISTRARSSSLSALARTATSSELVSSQVHTSEPTAETIENDTAYGAQSREAEDPTEETRRTVLGSQKATTHNNERSESTISKSEPGSAWLAAGAVLGAGAAAATAAKVVSTSSADEASLSQLNKAHGQAVEGAENDIVQPASLHRDVEELDKRKSLLDMKSLMIVNSPSGETSGQQSPQENGLQPPGLTRMVSDTSSHLANGRDKQAVPDQEMNEEGVGFIQSVPAVATSLVSKEEMPQARDVQKRPAKLDLANSALDREASPTKRASTPRTPRTFLDLTSDGDRADDQPVPSSAKTSNSPALTDAVKPYSPKKNGTSAASTPTSHRKQGSDVQEHPIVQKMASLKGSEPNSAVDNDTALPMTSAAIRGPEDFDSFVQGGETLKYTLTPEHVRDGPADTTTRYSPKPRQSPVEMDATPATPRHLPSSANSQTGRSPQSKTSKAEKRRSSSRPAATNTVTHRSSSGLLAREPRVLTESTQDFADFIRSTGPNKEDAVRPILPNASSASLHSLRSAHIQGASSSTTSLPNGDRSRSMMTNGSDAPPVPPLPRSTKSNMQPRGAKVSDGGSSDLIDFIRSGPTEDGRHRIPRTVAPFRTTMDSDQFGELGARESAENQVASSVRTGSSFPTSFNSRSALLNGANGVGRSAAPVQHGASRDVSENSMSAPSSNFLEDAEPTRKRYRSKDPYAIDFDDDENDEADDLMPSVFPKKNNDRNESMLDFLKTHEPPSSGPPQLLIDPNSAHARRLINDARAKSQGYAAGGQPRSMQAKAGPRPPPANLVPNNGQAKISSTVTSNPSKMQARNSPSSTSRTSDLADFFRNAGPVNDQNTAPAPLIGRSAKSEDKPKKKRGSIFSRRRNNNTYLDMP